MLDNYFSLNIKPSHIPNGDGPPETKGVAGGKRFSNGLGISIVSSGDPDDVDMVYGSYGQPPEERMHEVHIGLQDELLGKMSLSIFSPEYDLLAHEIRNKVLAEAGIENRQGFEHAYLRAEEIDRIIPIIERQPPYDCSPYDNPNGRAQLKDRTKQFFKDFLDCDLDLK